MREECQCLANWIDTAECICIEPEGTPMPLDTKALARANKIIEEISRLDRAIPKIDRCDFSGGRSKVNIALETSGNYPSHIEIYLPKEFSKALVFFARAQKYDELRQTGIVSTNDQSVRQVVS